MTSTRRSLKLSRPEPSSPISNQGQKSGVFSSTLGGDREVRRRRIVPVEYGWREGWWIDIAGAAHEVLLRLRRRAKIEVQESSPDDAS